MLALQVSLRTPDDPCVQRYFLRYSFLLQETMCTDVIRRRAMLSAWLSRRVRGHLEGRQHSWLSVQCTSNTSYAQPQEQYDMVTLMITALRNSSPSKIRKPGSGCVIKSKSLLHGLYRAGHQEYGMIIHFVVGCHHGRK